MNNKEWKVIGRMTPMGFQHYDSPIYDIPEHGEVIEFGGMFYACLAHHHLWPDVTPAVAKADAELDAIDDWVATMTDATVYGQGA